MTRNDNHNDDAYIRKRLKMYSNSGATPWSDLDHDVLFVVMMKLGAVDFVAFSGVCKSWRSLAKRFMALRPPMSIRLTSDDNEHMCYLKIDGRMFKTTIPQSNGRECVGLTCGYLILFGWKTKDFWLVNPITRHELHFPNFPYDDVPFHPTISPLEYGIRAILVFSPSVSGWVFIMLDKFFNYMSFSIAGKGAWNHVSTTFPIIDLHAFKGKIYTIDNCCRVYEMRLNSEPKLTLLEIKNFMKPHFSNPEFVSSGENLYVMDRCFEDMFKVQELDFAEMKWVMPKEKTIEKYAFFSSNLNDSVVIKPKPWADPQSQYEDLAFFPDKLKKCRFFFANMWYFPHECLDANLIDE